jgi:hypothetical protein
MGTKLAHAGWLKKTNKKLKSVDGKQINVYELIVDQTDAATLKEWARHFREHYCLDAKLDRLRKGTDKTRAEFLIDRVFPNANDGFGPATRAGDFAEILVADLLERHLGYWVPRIRYSDKMVRDESAKGTDVMGFHLEADSPDHPSSKDRLIAIESKAQMSGKKANPRLQDAVNDSLKDKWRIGESLHAIKRRLIDQDQDDEADVVERFQEGNNVPYVTETGAAAVLCSNVYDESEISKTDCKTHWNASNLALVVIHSKDFMKLVHSLYQRAADEA